MVGMEQFADAWDRLGPATDNIFSTREWAECWWRHFGSGCTFAPLLDDDTDPSVMVPLVRSGRALRRLRLVGAERADALGPLSRPADRPRAAQLIARARDEGRLDADVLLLQDQPVAADWWRPLGGTVLRTVASPAVQFPDAGWDEYVAGKSKNMRSQMRTKENRLRREHEVVTRVSTPDELSTDLATFWRLHVQRWGDSAEFAQGPVRAFTEDFCRVAMDRGWLRLRILELDGTARAAQLNFRYGSSESLYQAGRDPAFDTSSVGFVMMTDTLRSMCEDGLREFRFLRGNDAYKYRFANVAADVQSVVVPLTRRGCLAAAVAARRPDADEIAPVELPRMPDRASPQVG